MGGRKNQQYSWPSSKDAGGPSWHIWHGARSPAQRPWKQPEAKAAAWKFPTFDSRQVAAPAAKAAPSDSGHGLTLERHQRLRDLQGLVNGARKAESRLSRAVAAKERAQAQWQQYLADMKTAYLKEQKRYFQLLERQEKEVAEAAEGQEQAHAVICQAAFQGELSGPMEMEDVSTEQAGAWDQMLHGWEEEGGGEDADVLRRALGGFLRSTDGDAQLRQALGSALQYRTPTRGTGAMPRTPPGMERRPAPVAEEAPRGADPYPSPAPTESLTPSVAAAMQKMSVQPPPAPVSGGRPAHLHPGQRDPSRARVPSSVEAPRPNIKDATKVLQKGTPSSALSEKLEAKRLQMLSASMTSLPRGKGMGHPSGEGQTMPVHIQDDDFSSDMEEVVGPEPTAVAEHVGEG